MDDPVIETALEGRIVSLESLQPGESGIVEIVEAGQFENGLSVRLRALGLSNSHQVSMVRRGWFGGPLVVRAGKATEIAIRRSEAELVKVRKI
ncbi:FeoA family protein [Martelella mediterranea]|uniref:FeoA domain protein n=1 Tax=Martelella mediterranea DSM 17316 TaxID=1122214 RepID=A0A1U9YZA3_9HYPH|nr:FeoA family protein [Martelella mediterranea]AQZ50771.1 FeoA domain protein [Martelella mediterranea DSM 17316]